MTDKYIVELRSWFGDEYYRFRVFEKDLDKSVRVITLEELARVFSNPQHKRYGCCKLIHQQMPANGKYRFSTNFMGREGKEPMDRSEDTIDKDRIIRPCFRIAELERDDGSKIPYKLLTLEVLEYHSGLRWSAVHQNQELEDYENIKTNEEKKDDQTEESGIIKQGAKLPDGTINVSNNKELLLQHIRDSQMPLQEFLGNARKLLGDPSTDAPADAEYRTVLMSLVQETDQQDRK